MEDYVYIAIVHPLDADLEDMQTGAFLSVVSAQKWVDGLLAGYEEDGIEVKWDIRKETVR